MKTEKLTMYGVTENGLCTLEAIGFSKVFAAYGEYANNTTIMEGGVGFNHYSGYVYIALEEGITICSMLGRDVEYLVTNFNNGEEFFFDNYEEAKHFCYELAKG